MGRDEMGKMREGTAVGESRGMREEGERGGKERRMVESGCERVRKGDKS